jgi:integrase
MRPIKKRYIDGVALSDNLYSDPKGRQGYYRYKQESGKFKTFRADSVEAANTIAEKANALRGKGLTADKAAPQRDQLAFHVPLYIAYRVQLDPSLADKRSWDNRRYALNLFAEKFPSLSQINLNQIRGWWDELTYNQQKLRMAEFRRFFNWLMGQGLCAKSLYNPFTTADDRPRLMFKSKPAKTRPPLSLLQYHAIYKMAGTLGYPALQLAMNISRYTTMREADICSLRFDKHIVDGCLRVVVSKSEAQKGTARAARLAWSLSDHPILKREIDRARELSLLNRRCPYLLSHEPINGNKSKRKDHFCQLLPDRLSRMFRETRDACDIKGTCFHEVRGLSSTLYRLEGYDNSEIQALMAHESVHTTIGYQNESELPYEKVTLNLSH